MYIHDLNEWPALRWDIKRLQPFIEQAKELQTELFEQLSKSCFDELEESLRSEASLEMLTQEVVKTSEIEGQNLDPEQVRSSIAVKLGLDLGGLRKQQIEQKDRSVDGIVDVVLDATQNWKEPLTKDRLYKWHHWLFPAGYSELGKITVAQWREGSIQVISSPFRKQKVHFEGPAALRLPAEMETFLNWFESPQDIDPILKAGVAHLYFVTLHPFEDGNGRIARAIADLAMARADGVNQRFYSMSAQIRADRKEYYIQLEQTQKGTLDITNWLEWFLRCLIRSLLWAQQALHAVIRKADVLREMKQLELNERQYKIMIKYLNGGFGDLLNSTKYKFTAICSPDTANRDLKELVELGILERTGQGKKTSYKISGAISGSIQSEMSL
jgi:Uncharacterized conserved protein